MGREPTLRAVLLGASNLRISLPLVLDRVRLRAGGPVEALTACGHGRSYGAWSRFLFVRHLPGIAGCGLWKEIRERPPLPTLALVTDAGNDLLYGARVEEVAGWVELCLDRLAAQEKTEIVITLLPLARLERLSGPQVRLAATLLFPGRPAPWPALLDRAREPRRAAAADRRRPGRAPRRARGLLVRARSHPPPAAGPPGGLGPCPSRPRPGCGKEENPAPRHGGEPPFRRRRAPDAARDPPARRIDGRALLRRRRTGAALPHAGFGSSRRESDLRSRHSVFRSWPSNHRCSNSDARCQGGGRLWRASRGCCSGAGHRCRARALRCRKSAPRCAPSRHGCRTRRVRCFRAPVCWVTFASAAPRVGRPTLPGTQGGKLNRDESGVERLAVRDVSRFLGIALRQPQPAIRWRDGSTVALY